MISNPLTLDWPDADATARCAVDLGKIVQPGDVLLLSGPVGAGKSHFARALIQSLLSVPEDIPSPTFTLVQTYDTQSGALWHTDLYRLSTETDIDELGLSEAFENAICLVEWPDRLGRFAPENALSVEIFPGREDRTARFTWTDAKWQSRLADMVQNV